MNRFIGKLSHKAGSETAVQSVLVHQVVQDSLGASREIKTLKKVEAFVNKFYEPKRKHSHAVASISYLTSLPRFIVEPALMIGAVMLAGFSLNTDGGLATLGIFLTGGLRIMAAMLPLQSALGIVRQLLAMSEKFIELNSKFIPFNGESSVINSLEIRLNEGNIGPVSIQIHNLEFKYEGNLPAAINSVNISIASGSLVAIVGPSGSGKSTLADILVGGLMPTSGKINFYSDRGKLINFGDFRIGYVPQNPGIVSGTILENITFETDLNQINFDALEAALSLSHLKSVIEGLPNGINSRVGEQLDDLSGGQFQRIGLARALYSQPNLLVLDEATSALDMETEGAIKETLDSLKGQVTTLVIAHRLSTVSSADQVLVLENGQIQDFGTFKELKLRNSVVSRYVELSNLNQD